MPHRVPRRPQLAAARRLAVFALAVGAAGALTPTGNAVAQSGDGLSERAFLEELPVLSVSRLPQSLADVPGAVTVFDREFIRNTGYREVGELLRLVPGMGVVNDRGHSPWISYHGLGSDYSNRMQVLVDGRSVYSPSLIGGADWSGLPLTIDEIERIEVLRGSNAATYGSNAFLGVVNIITRHAADDRGLAASVSAGERGLFDGFARYGAQSGPVAVRLNANHVSDSGFRRLTDTRRSDIFTLRTDWQINPRDSLSFWAGANEGRRTNGFTGSPNNTNGLRELRSGNRFAHLRFRRAFDAGNELSVGVYRNDESIDEGFQSFFPPFFPVVPVNIDRQSSRDNFDFQHTVTLSPTLRMAWGAEGRRDWVQGASSFYAYGDASSRLWRTFANAEWRVLPSLVVNGGAMVERYNGNDPRIAPRLFANWTALPGQTLRVGFAESYREPSLFEQRADQRFYSGPVLLQYAIAGSGTLRPERVRSHELGWNGQWGGARPFNVDLRLFREELTDLIDRVSAPTPAGFTPVTTGTNTYVNIDQTVYARGAELQLRAKPWTGADVFFGGTAMSLRGYKPELERTAARRQWNVTWMQRIGGGWSSTLSWFHVGSRQWIGSEITPAFHYVDARIAYAFRLWTTNAEWSVSGRNLGSARNEFRLNASYVPTEVITPLVFTSLRLEL